METTESDGEGGMVDVGDADSDADAVKKDGKTTASSLMEASVVAVAVHPKEEATEASPSYVLSPPTTTDDNDDDEVVAATSKSANPFSLTDQASSICMTMSPSLLTPSSVAAAASMNCSSSTSSSSSTSPLSHHSSSSSSSSSSGKLKASNSCHTSDPALSASIPSNAYLFEVK